MPPAAAPPVTLVVSNITSDEGGELIGSLQPLIRSLLANPPSEGQVPTIQPDQVQGGDALTLRLTPSLALTYAISAAGCSCRRRRRERSSACSRRAAR